MSDKLNRVVDWLPFRVRDGAVMAADRLAERRATISTVALLTVIFVLFGGLSVTVASIGLSAAVVWAALWPSKAIDLNLAEYDRSGFGVRAGTDAWRAVIDGLPDPVIALDSDSVVAAYNRAAAELFPAATRGKHIAQISRAPELLTAIETAFRTDDAETCRMDFKVPVMRSLTGTVIPIAVAAEFEGAPRMMIVLRDLTEQDRLMRMRADFVANASHEMRTPLASLKGFVETLQGAAKDDAVARQRFLGIMQQQADRMTRLIEDLLSLSRIEMHAHVAPRDSVDLAQIVAHVLQTLEPIAHEKSIRLACDPLPALVVVGDRDELVQVFQNLIENAIKYGRNGGEVAISAAVSNGSAARGKTATLSIRDDGPGIAPQHLPRLTERFYRVSATHSRNTGGTGLGLAIVKHVLNRHRADLSIQSTVGVGSTFSVTFPVP